MPCPSENTRQGCWARKFLQLQRHNYDMVAKQQNAHGCDLVMKLTINDDNNLSHKEAVCWQAPNLVQMLQNLVPVTGKGLDDRGSLF